jgi:HlyD family secretion protein
MATTTFPPRAGIRRGRWLIGGIIVIVLGVAAAVFLNTIGSTTTEAPATTTATRGTIVASVAGSGTITAAQTLNLSFATSGTVAEVLVAEGDTVTVGQALARLDERTLKLDVDTAQANLDKARAQLGQTQQGNATPEELAAQQASVANAAANLDKTRTGNVTAADIAEAEAQLRSAQAQLDDLRAGAKPENVSSAQLTLNQARSDAARLQASLQETTESLSKAKTDAEIALKQASIELQTAQSEYSTAYWQYQNVQNNGRAPSENEGSSNPELSDYGNLEQQEAFKQAELNLQNAQETLNQRQIDLDNARQAEVTGVAQAEQQLASAQAQVQDAEVQLRVVQQGATALELAQAEASVEQYQASLQKLQQGGTPADIAIARAQLDEAQANLNQLTAPQAESNIAIEQSNVAVAEQELKQAQLNLEQATLAAPFAGVVTELDIVPGSVVGTEGVASLIDRSTLHVDMTLSENDVAQVALGQPVTITIDALRDYTGEGTVSYIAPAGEGSNGVVTYKVRVSFPDDEPRVKVGMTANLKITTATSEDALLVPNSALLPKGAGRVVLLPNADGTTREVDVTTGLSDGVNTEITSGLNAGDRVVTTPGASQEQQQGGLFGG